MIDLKIDMPLKKDVIEEIAVTIATIRDELTEIESLVRMATQERQFLKTEEVQAIIRSEKIPDAIPRIRRGTRSIFEKSDVYKYLDSKKR